jgi:hexosaminidase
MRTATVALLLVLAIAPAVFAQAPLSLRFELKEDVFDGRRAASRVVLTLTNTGTKPLPARGFALYWNALSEPVPGSIEGGFTFERVTGGFQRFVPAEGFAGLAPGQSVAIEYLTGLMTNISFAPVGPYVVFDDEPTKGHALRYERVPFERPPQQGDDPRVVTPQAQFELNKAIRAVPLAELPPVFPTPLLVEKREGTLTLAAPPAITTDTLAPEAVFAAEALAPYFPKAKPRPGQGAALRLEVGKVEGQASPEAYELVVDPANGMRIVGNSPAGVFYGLQSLRSLLPAPAAGKGLTLPALRVLDAPRFGHRGFMMDVSRNFQPKAQVLRVIDLMARYKLNVLHFHMTEDEAWRVEIDGLPELTSVGARRGHTLDSAEFLPPAWGSGPDVTNPYGSGYYTRAEYQEILKYAAARHVEVVPEIEMPGHARAAIKAMEARARRLRAAGDEKAATQYLLSDPEDKSVYTSAQLYHDNIMNPALDSTYAFIERVVDELVLIHQEAGVPLRNLHMGGDEVPRGVWERSPAVAAYLKQHGLAATDELWYVFYGRVEQILKKHGLPLAGWEEIGLRSTRLDGQPKLVPNPTFAGRGWTTYVWNNVPGWGNEDLAYRLANGGYKVVFSPVTNTYLDMAWNKNPEETGLHWGGFVDLRKPFEFIPHDYWKNLKYDHQGNSVDRSVFVGKDRLTDYGKANIVGIQANLWSETINYEGALDYKLVPKLLAFAERAWAKDPEWAREKDPAKAQALFEAAYSVFANVVGQRELPRLDRETPAWLYRIPKPGLAVVGGQVRVSLEIPGFPLRYTTDGTEPTVKSPLVRGPIPVASDVRVAAFDTNGRKGHTARLAAR